MTGEYMPPPLQPGNPSNNISILDERLRNHISTMRSRDRQAKSAAATARELQAARDLETARWRKETAEGIAALVAASNTNLKLDERVSELEAKRRESEDHRLATTEKYAAIEEQGISSKSALMRRIAWLIGVIGAGLGAIWGAKAGGD